MNALQFFVGSGAWVNRDEILNHPTRIETIEDRIQAVRLIRVMGSRDVLLKTRVCYQAGLEHLALTRSLDGN